MFTCIKSLNRYNLKHNNCIIFSIFLYFKYSFLSNSFIYRFVHTIIFLFIKRKAISYLSVELPKIYQYWSCLIILQSSTVAYKRVAYKKISSVLKFGISWKHSSDQDPVFESELFQCLMSEWKIKKLRTTGYNP